MRHACAFFATELPSLHDSITTLCADLSWRDLGPLSKALENLHHRLSSSATLVENLEQQLEQALQRVAELEATVENWQQWNEQW